MPAAVPAKIVVKAVASILAERRAALARVQVHAGGAWPAGRQASYDRLWRELKALGPLLEARLPAAVDAGAVGLLCAWATGHYGSLAALEDYLAAAKHPQARAVAALQGDDLAAAVRLLCVGTGA